MGAGNPQGWESVSSAPLDTALDNHARPGRPWFTGHRRTTVAYGLAIVCCAVAFAVSRALHRPLLKLSPFVLFYAAVAVSSWFGGFGPGLLAAVIGTAVADFYLFEPRGSSSPVREPLDTVTLLIFLSVGVLISGLKAKLRDVRRLADDLSADARRSEGRWRRLSEANLIAVFFADLDGNVRWGNGEFHRLAGCTPDEVAAGSVNWLALTVPEHAPQDVRAMDQLRNRGVCEPFEKEHRLRDGRTIPVVVGCAVLDEEPPACVGFVLDQTGRRRAEDDLREHQARLSALSAELLVIEERERRRIATVLHDAIGQNLMLAKLRLGALAGGSDVSTVQTERLAAVGQLLDEAIDRTRTLTSEVSPPVLYELGLEAAVRWLAGQARQRHGFRVAVHDDGQPKPLSGTARLVLFDGVRELLANAAKHAGGQGCSVSVARDGDTVRVEVRDCGPGFSAADAEPSGGGFGLFNLRERLRRIGGHMEISTLPGHGGHVTLVAPIEVGAVQPQMDAHDAESTDQDPAHRRPPDDARGVAEHAGRAGRP
jgi:PAS domain S-box-containing protein